MIYEADLKTRKKLFPLFAGMNDTCILSCLQGHMGCAWVDNLENPTAAQIVVGDFVFYAGDDATDEAKELLRNLPIESFVIAGNAAWQQLVETIYPDTAKKIRRFGFRKNPADLHSQHIKGFLDKLPEGYELKRIDASIAAMPSLQEISPDFTGQFDSAADFVKRGIGYCIMYQGEVVCAASSYSIYDDGIEIEIGTAPGHRRKGLATVVAAALILACLQDDKYPSWDAANEQSEASAKKLGYVSTGVYDAYHIIKG